MSRVDNTYLQQPKRPVLLIGWDGATFDLIKPWTQAGHLPNVSRLMANGAWGEMQSTIPAHSAPAWSTFATGLQPGRHGIYWFLAPTRDEQHFRPISAESIHGRTLWDLIGAQGRRVGVVNVPLTYPPRPVNGYMIAGMLSPDTSRAFWPPELYEDVKRHVGEYIIEVYGHLDRQVQLEKILAAIDQRCRTVEYLMDKQPTDCLIVVFRMLDSVQHKFWADMDPRHPLHEQLGKSAIPEAILSCYRRLDTALGRLMDKAGPETTVILMSDHGFRGDYSLLAVNKWLRDRGLLVLHSGVGSLATRMAAMARQLGLSRMLGNVVRNAAGADYRRSLSQRWRFFYRSVDWSRTKVIFGPNFGFNINLQGRDVEGIVLESEYEALRDQLIEELKAIRDSETGQPVVAEVYRREEIYEGGALDLAPDLIPEMAEYTIEGRRWGFGLNQNPTVWHLFIPPSPRMSGDHAPDGIFLAYGPGIQKGRVEGLHITDVAPTVMYTLGLTIPKTMEGRVRTELFDPAYVEANPVTYGDIDIALDGQSGQVLSQEYELLVEERLKDLGYL